MKTSQLVSNVSFAYTHKESSVEEKTAWKGESATKPVNLTSRWTRFSCGRTLLWRIWYSSSWKSRAVSEKRRCWRENKRALSAGSGRECHARERCWESRSTWRGHDCVHACREEIQRIHKGLPRSFSTARKLKSEKVTSSLFSQFIRAQTEPCWA